MMIDNRLTWIFGIFKNCVNLFFKNFIKLLSLIMLLNIFNIIINYIDVFYRKTYLVLISFVVFFLIEAVKVMLILLVNHICHGHVNIDKTSLIGETKNKYWKFFFSQLMVEGFILGLIQITVISIIFIFTKTPIQSWGIQLYIVNTTIATVISWAVYPRYMFAPIIAAIEEKSVNPFRKNKEMVKGIYLTVFYALLLIGIFDLGYQYALSFVNHFKNISLYTKLYLRAILYLFSSLITVFSYFYYILLYRNFSKWNTAKSKT